MSPKSKRRSKTIASNRKSVKAAKAVSDDTAGMPLLSDSSVTVKKVASIALVVATLTVALAFLLCWRFQFNSDGVLSGLMARSILIRGERPLYVWSVGYQGMLVNAYMNALMFKLFGFGVYQLNFWPTLAYLGLTSLFVAYVRRGIGDWVALGAGLFFVLSNPVICTVLMRNNPNYPETYAMGLGIFLIERHLLQQHYVAGKTLGAKSCAWLALMGFFCGFGAYTYGQIYLFIASVVAHLAFIYARDVIDSLSSHWNHWRAVGCIATLPLTVTAMGLWQFCTGGTPNPAFVPFVGANSIAVVARGVALLGLVAAAEFAVRRRALLPWLLPGIACMGAGVVVGYGPALWDIYVRMHPLNNKANMSGDLGVWLHRAWLGLEGNMWHLNLVPTPELSASVPVNVWATVATVGILAAFAWFCARHFGDFLRDRRASQWFLNMGPLLLLPLINILVFGLSDAVVNSHSSRYTLSAWLFYAVAFGWFFVTILQRAPRRWGWAATMLGLGLLGNNVNAIRRDLSEAMSQPFDGEDAIAYLNARGITRGYANYWSSYTVNFFTNEEIILQPMFSAYCPHYGPEVASADKIAVVDHIDRLGHPQTGAQIQLFGKPWIVGDYWHGTRTAVLTLDGAQSKNTAVVDGS